MVYFSCVLFQSVHTAGHIFFFKILRVSIIKKIREFIMSFSSAVRRSGIPSVLAWFLDLLLGHTFFFQNARNVYALLWGGWRG